MHENELVEKLKQKFQNQKIEQLNKFKSGKTELFVLSIRNKAKSKIFVKHYPHHENPQMILNEYKYQNTFYENTNDSTNIGCPKPIILDEKNNFLVMEYIEGKALRDLLLKIIPLNKELFYEIIELCGVALAKFHDLFIFENTYHCLKSEGYYNIWRVKTPPIKSQDDLSKCKLNTISVAYGDFGPAQILVRNGKVYLVDFPSPSEKKCIATPHLDIAKFRFYLKLLKYHPRFKFLKIHWWNLEIVFNKFLQKYCKKRNIRINKYDILNIRKLEKEFVINTKMRYENKDISNREILGKVKNTYMLRVFEDMIKDYEDMAEG